MINIIITIDYELFGNGRGDVRKHIIDPTDRLISIASVFNVPLTIMFEVFEYIHFEKYNKQLQNDLGYSPKDLIKSQIKEAYLLGNDVQLHIHPQFMDMQYRNGKLVPRNPQLSVFDLDEHQTYKLIKTAKEKLESLIPSSNFRCLALRLSNMGWIEAPPHAARAMEKLGIKVHSLSSVCAPVGEKGYLRLYDTSVYEIPIYTIPSRLYSFLKPRFLLPLLYLWFYDPPFSATASPNIGKGKYSSRLSSYKRVSMKWDLSKLSWRDMINMLDHAINHYNYQENEIPLIMIGHTKDFFNDHNFRRFLEVVNQKYVPQNIVRFTTLAEFIKENL
ncbi:hypothetical protein [Thermococcus sp. GR6]|uniref:hypothetical protein n=1 Tax=Thermococcus sp. GR6 TaxID=1638256 RepID=UPI00142FD950|nr:hypothetical protein [Thermococcus sp. GR6]NJE42904.1 hypothetical protein [Thermococcus sp. GR6]